MENGRLSIGLPIDVPFTDLNKLLSAQLKGHRYPEGGNAAVEVEVRSATLGRLRRPAADFAQRQSA